MTQLEPRDFLVLTIIAEMYGAPRDLVMQMLDVSRSRAYRIEAKWRDAHMISPNRARPVPGPSWIFPTKSAASALLGRDVRYWVPTPKMAAHTRAVLELRLALVGKDLDRWISERLLRAEVGMVPAGQSRPHIHDGRYFTTEGEWWAVEVELTAKNLAAARIAVLQARLAAERAECAGVTYFCRGEAVKNVVRAATADLDLRVPPKVTLRDLDTVLAEARPESSSPASRPGLRVIAGGVAADHEISQDSNSGKAVGS